MSQELKEKVKKSMMDYLKTQGWPNKLSDGQILQQHLKPMYVKLEGEGLLDDFKKQGLNFDKFVNIAVKKKQEADFFDHIRRTFGI